MSKSTRALIQIGVALMLAVAAGALIFMWTSKLATQKPENATAPITVEVVVAKMDIKRGTKLTEDLLDVKKFTPDSSPAGSFATIEELEGRVLSTNIGINEAITDSRLADPSIMGGGVSALIQPGKRAMAVKGNKVMGLAGFVRPGDFVDVLVTMKDEFEKQQTSRTRLRAVHKSKLILEKIKVLATGAELSPPDENGKTASVDVYTLEVTPDEAERLALASTKGTLNFALRNEQDAKDILTPGTTISKTLSALTARPQPKATSKGTSTKTVRRTYRKKHKVQVITGGKTKTVTF